MVFPEKFRRIITALFITALGIAASNVSAQELRTYFITCDSAEFQHIITHPEENNYISCAFEYDGSIWNDVRIRLKGGERRYFPKKSFKVNFDRNNRFLGRDKMNLMAEWNDPIAPRHGYLGQGQYAFRSLHFDATSLQIPESYALHQNYPNPFNPATTIHFDLPYQSKVKLEVFNILGQRVALLMDGILPAGYRSVIWNGRSDKGIELASGLYIYRLKAEALDGDKKFASIKKMILIK